MQRTLWAVLLLLCSGVCLAQQGRTFSAISKPEPLPAGATPVQVTQPVARDLVEEGVAMIASQWNTPQLIEVLAEKFYDAQRLQDTLLMSAPRDATLRVLSIGGQQTLQQYTLAGVRVSRVSVAVTTQVEFDDPNGGFQRREGTSEWILRITEESGGAP